MLEFTQQCKGKDLTDLASSAIPKLSTIVYNSTKFDGNYIQVIVSKENNEVRFFTSGGKEFYVQEYANDYLKLAKHFCCNDIKFEAEWIGTTDGLLGDREKSQGIITTWRTEFNKGIKSRALKDGKFKVFDYISLEPFNQRVKNLELLSNLTDLLCIDIVEHTSMTYEQARLANTYLTKNGYEGGYIKLFQHVHKTGKRVNTAIKDKPRPTYDLFCIATTKGEGKYSDVIGALILKDSIGRLVSCGSGLSDYDRESKDFVGKVIEIGAERRNSTTYIQPVYIGVRLDKTREDIS